LNDEVKEVEMGRARSTRGRRRMHIGYGWESQKKETTRWI
jgi:hypothetical protein